ncbi:putative disease resistance RPP13-like protein 1 [Panicum miliaceum]|uniref:Disease resistance RPP13-like protein 1 n=1 Tax=Panicum miliaceum TaxID=4540 RepID=A0A3L6TII1_PANMI|nr:putative disease resistance RPP13-like protein 1 [Panicum miliaceum]
MDDPDSSREDRSVRKRKRKGDKKEPETDPVIVPVPDELALRVKRILERFKEITKAWNDLHLDEADAPFMEEEEDFLPRPTTPHIDEPTRTMVQTVILDGGHNCFTIHDLFLDLAKFVSGEDILKLDIQYMLYLNDASQNLRYLSLAVSSPDHTVLDLHTLPVTGGLRILQVINALDDNRRYYSSLFKNNRRCFSKLFSHHINVTLPEDLRGLRHLRALDLSRSALTSLPESIGELKLLRYLCIFQTRIAKLPESICSLYNLKVLDARTNMLRDLPQDIQKLVSLQHLSLDLWSPLCMSNGIGKLKRLKTLTRYSVGTGNWHCNIAELHHLVNIRRELRITGLSRVTNIDDAQTANLVSKKHLQILRLDWSAGFYATECEHNANQNNATSTPELDEDVFESLKPQRNLEELEVVNYSGYKYPSWLGDPAFSRLAKVTLWKQKCKFLPALGQLPQLRELVIIHMECVERIGREFYGQDSVEPFPALEKLEFQDMPNWVEWTLKVCFLRKAEEIKLENLPMLEGLAITGCKRLLSIEGLCTVGSLSLLKIKDCPNLQLPLKRLPQKVQQSTVTNCPQLQEWAEWQQAQMSEPRYQLEEHDGASYDQEVVEALRDDSEDDFEVFSEDEDDDDFYDRILEAGQSSGMAIDYSDGSDDAC